MHLSLHRTKSLQTEIDDYIANGITTSASVSIYDPNTETTIADERNLRLATMAIMDRLESIELTLTKAIDHHNITSGITDLTAEQTILESRRDRLESLADHKPTSLHHSRARITNARESGYRDYGSLDRVGHISIDVLTPDDIDAAQKSLTVVKRRLHELTETLATLTLQTTIEIPPDDAEFLRNQGLL